MTGGLDSQSLCFDAWFFNCPAKATMLFLCNRDSSCASFLQTYKTPFSFSSRNHTTGCYLHQFLPLQKFLNEISICCLLLSQYPTRISSCVHTELLSFRCMFLLLSSWSEAVRSIRSSPVASTRTENFTRVRTNKIMEIMWLVDCLWNFLFCYVLVFFVCYKNVSFSKWTSEQSNGRQEPLNYHCEGLIVSFFQQFTAVVIVIVIVIVVVILIVIVWHISVLYSVVSYRHHIVSCV